MQALSIVVIFMICWWMIFFMLLPVGVTHDQPEIPGQQSGAPDHPGLKKKIMITSIIAVLLTGGIYYLTKRDDLSLRSLVHYWEDIPS